MSQLFLSILVIELDAIAYLLSQHVAQFATRN